MDEEQQANSTGNAGDADDLAQVTNDLPMANELLTDYEATGGEAPGSEMNNSAMPAGDSDIGLHDAADAAIAADELAQAEDNELVQEQLPLEGGTGSNDFDLSGLGDGLQEIGQAALDLGSQLLNIGNTLLALPFRLLPSETQSHLSAAAREAGYAVQSLFDEIVTATARAAQGVNETLNNMGNEGEQASNNAASDDDGIIVYEEIVVMEVPLENAGDEDSSSTASPDSNSGAADNDTSNGRDQDEGEAMAVASSEPS